MEWKTLKIKELKELLEKFDDDKSIFCETVNDGKHRFHSNMWEDENGDIRISIYNPPHE